jgi:hypothetical protein
MSEYRPANICNAATSAGLYPAGILPSQQMGKPLDPCIAALLAQLLWMAGSLFLLSFPALPAPSASTGFL